MALCAELLLHRGTFTLDAGVRVKAGETLALLGPNGSGKSTMLAAIAGLLVPERGTVEVNGRTLTKVGGADRVTAVEPHARRVGFLGQDPLLFPHLSALENVAFGARASGKSAAQARAEAAALLDEVGLKGLERRRPEQLSGGQQQRVAIARALAAEPDVLLLDEPMAALDVHNASSVRTLLRERLRATALPAIVVSHDVVDAMVLADRVAIMDEGRIVDIGTPEIVLGQPTNQFAANLVGLNLILGTMGSDGEVHTTDGRRLGGVTTGHRSELPPLRVGESVVAAFPPSGVRVSTELDHGHDAFSWRATVSVLEPAVRGIRVSFVGETFVAELAAAELLLLGLREGMAVKVSVDAALTRVYRPRAQEFGAR